MSNRKNRPLGSNQPQTAEAQAGGTGGFWQRFSTLKVELSMSDDSALRHVPFLMYLTLLGLIYIANNHYAEEVAGRITKKERVVKELQMEYSTLKYEYMTASNKEEVASKLEKMGLVPNDKLITKIEVEK